MNEAMFLAGFLVFIFICLALDLGVFNKKIHEVSLKESLITSIIWIALALVFFIFLQYFGHWMHNIHSMEDLIAINEKHNHGILFDPDADFLASLQLYRKQLSLEFITGYVIEKTLSIDNIFVILLIFTSFCVDKKDYHRVLFWGIIGAIVMRFLFIFSLSALIQQFEWILAVFGVFLVYTAVKMYLNRDKKEEMSVEHHPVVKFVSKHFRVTPDFVGHKFFVKIKRKHFITPLFLVVIIIELSDVIFAVDSVPAIFSITQDSYIVFFSNIFAIIGLRALFFLLSSIVNLFRFLKTGISILLAFIGLKMLLEIVFHVSIGTAASLVFILSTLVVCIALSLIIPPNEPIQKASKDENKA